MNAKHSCRKAGQLIVLAASAAALLSGGPTLAQDAPGDVSVAIPVNAYEISMTADGHKLSVPDFGYLLVPGKPALPSRIFAIAIPPGAEVLDVTYDTAEPVVLPGFYAIPPAPLPRVIGKEDPALYQRDLKRYQRNHDEIYESDDPYPAKTVEFVRKAGYRKYNLVDVRVTPFTYRARSGELVYHPQIVVHVHYRPPQRAVTPMVDNLVRAEQVAEDLILNYRQAAQWYPQERTSRQGVNDFVIITLDSLTSAVQPLVDWEEAKGRTVEVVTTSWIAANYTGTDLAAEMRIFLREKYPSEEWGVEDVLMVGHYDDVPIRRTWQDVGYGMPETDFYFAELSQSDTTSWDANWNEHYGEDSDPIDFYAEVNVSRIPWSDASTVQSVCEKSAAYEQNNDPAFKMNILLLGAYFWENTDNAVLMEAKVDQPWMEDWTMTRMYEQNADYWSSYPCDYPLFRDGVQDVWSSGTYAFVNWAGHGSPTSSHILGEGAPAFIAKADCSLLNDDYPAIIFADACSNHDTDEANIGREMIKQGGVGFLGATKVALGRPGWTGPFDGSSQSMDYFFTIAVTSGDYSIGQAHQWALQQMYQYGLWSDLKYETFEWGALLGNPDLRMPDWADNDDCSEASPVYDGTYSGGTTFAFNDGDASCGNSASSADVWFVYQAMCGGTLTVDTCGSSYDTVLSVHSFCPGSPANELACNNDSCGQQSVVSVPVTVGTMYLIRVSGYDGDHGDFVLNVSGPEDLTPPSPDPMSFAVAPMALSTSSISMTATTASDSATPPVKYYFDFVNVQMPGGHDSGWQTSPDYTDTGLFTNCLYAYNVRARDSAIPANQTAPSADFTVATFIQTPQLAPVVVIEATTATLATTESFTNLTWGQSGLYFDCLTSDGDGGINEWAQMASGTAMDLTPDTNYTFRFKARNQDAVETDWSPTQTRRTKAAVPSAPVLSNATCASMDVAIGDDINPSYTTYAIHCTSTSPTDANWEGLYADASGNPTGSAVYQTQAEWGTTTLMSMAELTTYGFEVIARNASGITTAPGPEASLTTESCGSTPTCDDGILNQGEDRIDCGGPCPPCSCLSDGACDNGQYCDGVETCDAWGECQPGTSVDCDDSIACTVDSCNETTDQCDNVPDDAFCGNGLFCDGAEWCDLASGCQLDTSVDCDDSIACTVDSCNEATDQCDNVPDDAFCDNGLFCDGAEWCDPAVGCQDGADPCGPDETCNEEQDVCESLPFCATLPDPAVCKGDVNGNGVVDPSDVGLVKFWYGDTDPASLCSYDVNCDGTIDTSDVGLVKFYYGTCGPESEAPCWAQP